MTANQMADKVELLLNLKDAEYAYEDIELTSILNKAQVIYVNQFIEDRLNYKQEGFEETEIRGWGLAPLLAPSTLTQSTSQADIFPNGKYYDLPADFWTMVTETPTSSKLLCGSTTSYIIPMVAIVTHDEYQKSIRNHYKKPYINQNDGLVWRMYDSGRRVQLITDGTFTITSYKIKYLKSIPDINVDRAVPANQVNCILESTTKEVHEAIVEIAVRLIRKSNSEPNIPDLGIEQLN
jgi:hypothetical protein